MSTDITEPIVQSRRDFRSLVFHLLYSMDAFQYDVPLQTVIDQFNRGYDLAILSNSEVALVTQQIIDKRNEIDTLLAPLFANWRLERLECCTHLILYLAVWEMLYTDTPPTVIINEAIELSKCFSEKDAYKFVNGVLDEFLKRLPQLKIAQAEAADQKI